MIDLRKISSHFCLYGNYLWAETIKAGHINDTCIGVFNQAGMQVRYIFQRINTKVFQDPDKLMDNISRVIAHINGKLGRMKDASRRVMTLIPTRDGKWYWNSPELGCWRCYLFIERARAYNVMEAPEYAYQAAWAFGNFQGQLSDIPQPRLYDTIPDFHHTVKRLEAFDKALKADEWNRASEVKSEIRFVNSWRAKASVVLDGLAKKEIPERITHNDTKLNNVLLDDETGEAVCVIDLDTIMPGSSLYDFGDLVRGSVSPAEEDERDLSLVTCRDEIYDALVHGFLDGCQGCLNKREIELLPFAGQLITFETGVRFLTDYLDGDKYFKVHRERHNIDRCRTQFRLVKCLMEKEDALRKLTEKYIKA